MEMESYQEVLCHYPEPPYLNGISGLGTCLFRLRVSPAYGVGSANPVGGTGASWGALVCESTSLPDGTLLATDCTPADSTPVSPVSRSVSRLNHFRH